MSSLVNFKAQMTSPHAPNYVSRYCEDLSGQKWEWFYTQMKNAMEIAANVDCLMYVLKWILKSNFDDLVYEVYFVHKYVLLNKIHIYDLSHHYMILLLLTFRLQLR